MTFPDLAAINKVRSESEIHDYYMNKNYIAPEKIQLETIFEAGGKRGASENGELISGKNKAKRYIEEYSFWKQNDKDKNCRRKLKIKKQFKGRKRPKIVSSSIEQETWLIEQIQNAPAVDNLVDTSRYEQSDIGELLDQAYEIILLRCRRTYLEANAALPAASASQEPEPCEVRVNKTARVQQLQDQSPAEHVSDQLNFVGSRFVTSSWNESGANSVLIPEISDKSKRFSEISTNDTNCSTNLNDDVFTSQVEQSTEDTISTDDNSQQYSLSETSDCSRKDTKEDFDPSLILQSMKDDAMKEEFLKALEDTDLMFCEDPLPKQKAAPKKADRMSMRRSVRRSARFMNHERDVAGSVDIEVDVQVKQAKAKKKKNVEPLVDDGNELKEDAPKETADVSKENQDKVKKKRRMVAQIDLFNNSDKENVPIKARVNSKRKPTFRREMSTSSSSESDSEKKEEGAAAVALDTSVIAADHVTDSSNTSRRSLMDISLPDCVRRSLTGEFVPLPHLLLHEEHSQEDKDKESGKKEKRKSLTRQILGPLPIPEITIEPSPSYEIDKLEKSKDYTSSNFLQVPDKGIRKDSFECFSDEEVFITGLLKFGKKKKSNDLLNKRIMPSISSKSSVDSDFS